MIQWNAESSELIRSADGRFDLIFARAERLWLAIDHDAPVSQVKLPTLAEVQHWCERRARKGRGAK